MGTKATFDPVTRIITLTEAPDADGDVIVDVQVDLYSDGKEDWVTTEALRRVLFPIESVGGNSRPGGESLGSTFYLATGWKIQPYDADHRLTVAGNFYVTDGSDPFLNVAGRTVRIMMEVSALTSVMEVQGVATEELQEFKSTMSDNGADAVFGVWVVLDGEPRLDLNSIEARVKDTQGNVVYELGAQVLSTTEGVYRFTMPSSSLLSHTAYYLNLTATKTGESSRIGNIPFAKLAKT